MKSSSAVFTRQNPFPPPPRIGKVHYHPSRNQVLSKEKKKTALSPVRSTQRSNPHTQTQSSASKQPADKHHAAEDGPVFTEIWPSTDSGTDEESPKQSAGGGTSTVSSDPQGDSVMAKYIERFRHGRPQSREERQLEPLPLWWMSSSSSPASSTPTKTIERDHNTRSLRDDMVSPDTSQGDFDDAEILDLKERLLLREYDEDDGSVPVSSNGDGCSDFTSPLSVDEQIRQPVIPGFIISSTAKISSTSNEAMTSRNSAIPSFRPPACPGEDILSTWRLRRKLERDGEQQPSRHGSAVSWQLPDIHRPSAGEHAYKQQQSFQHPELWQRDPRPLITHHPQSQAKDVLTPIPSASHPPPAPALFISNSPPVSQLQTVAHVPAHMHLVYDLLHCPIQLSQASAQKPDVQRSDDTKVVSTKPHIPENRAEVLTEEPVCEHASSSSVEAVEKEESEINKKSETKKAAAAFVRKQKKPTRYAAEHTDVPSSSKWSSSQQRLPKKVIPPTEQQQQQQQQSQRVSPGCCPGTGDHRPLPSPLHRALGKTVSEVLFPAVDSSSPARRTSHPSAPHPFTSSANPPSTVPDTQNSVEVISQLLQEAEDSDEKEFEDDTLLQVLRKQRRWVKQQIREAESVMTEILDEQQVT